MKIEIQGMEFEADLSLPQGARTLVILARCKGKGYFSPRNLFVAQALQAAGMATLLMDIGGREEAGPGGRDRDLPLWAQRVEGAVYWAKGSLGNLARNLALFGSEAGVAAVLTAAARLPNEVSAVVARGGRPDLVMDLLPLVKAPTLLIVGERDGEALEWNRRALSLLQCEKELKVVEGASHLFQEPGTLHEVAVAARRWFAGHGSLESRVPQPTVAAP